MTITTKVVSSNLVHGKVYWKQHYVIKFVNDVRQVSVFLRVLWFPPPIKMTATIYIVESGVKHPQPNLNHNVCGYIRIIFFCTIDSVKLRSNIYLLENQTWNPFLFVYKLIRF